MEAPLKIPLKPLGAKGVKLEVLVSTAPGATVSHTHACINTHLWHACPGVVQQAAISLLSTPSQQRDGICTEALPVHSALSWQWVACVQTVRHSPTGCPTGCKMNCGVCMVVVWMMATVVAIVGGGGE
jgi:hypothetical protein